MEEWVSASIFLLIRQFSRRQGSRDRNRPRRNRLFLSLVLYAELRKIVAKKENRSKHLSPSLSHFEMVYTHVLRKRVYAYAFEETGLLEEDEATKQRIVKMAGAVQEWLRERMTMVRISNLIKWLTPSMNDMERRNSSDMVRARTKQTSEQT